MIGLRQEPAFGSKEGETETRRRRTRPTALFYGAVLPSYKGVHGVAPRLLLYTATVAAIVGGIAHFREHLQRKKGSMVKLGGQTISGQHQFT